MIALVETGVRCTLVSDTAVWQTNGSPSGRISRGDACVWWNVAPLKKSPDRVE